MLPPYPAMTPRIRFLFVRPAFCLGLPSDSPSRETPLPSASTSPYRACRGLSPPSHPEAPPPGTAPIKALRAVPGAQQKAPSRRCTGLGSWRAYRARSSRRGSRLPRPLTPPGKRIRTTAVPVPHYRAELRSAEFARLCALSASTVFGLPARHTVIESPPGRLLLVHIREWSTIHS